MSGSTEILTTADFQEWMKKMFRSIKEDYRSIREDLQSMAEDSRKFREKLRNEREQSRPKVDDDKPEIEEVPEDKNIEQASPEPEDSVDKKIQITQETEEVKMEERRTCLLYTSRCV